MGQPRRSGGLVRLASEYVGNVTVAALAGGAISLVTSGLLQLLGRQLRGAVFAFLAVGLILVLIGAATGFENLKRAALTRRGLYGFNTTVMVLLFLAIGAIVIFVGAKNNARFDVTETKDFSLSRQTKDVLKGLGQDVQAVAFFVPTSPQQILARGSALDLLEEYSRIGSKFSFRVVDPELHPGEARALGINPDTNPGSIVFSSGGSLQPVPTLIVNRQGEFIRNNSLERDFTQAVLAVTHKSQKVVYFLTRHGERDPVNVTEGTEFGRASVELEGDNYLVNVLDLAAEKAVPSTAAVLIIASPKSDLLDEEVAPLNDYLKSGGRALFLMEPQTPPRFKEILKTWGVEIPEGTVVDFSSSVSGAPRAPLVRRDRYNPLPGMVSPITQPITDVTFFQDAAAIVPLKGPATNPDLPNIFYQDPPGISIIPLAVTNPGLSWVETDPERNRRDPNELAGPLALAVAIEARAPFGVPPPIEGDTPITKIVVFGDGDFASSRFITSFGNRDMFLNSVNWLAGDFNLISVRPKLLEPRLLIVTQRTWNFIRWSSLLILPLVVGVGGGVAWWRRR